MVKFKVTVDNEGALTDYSVDTTDDLINLVGQLVEEFSPEVIADGVNEPKETEVKE